MHTIETINIEFLSEYDGNERLLGEALSDFVKQDLAPMIQEVFSKNDNYYATSAIIDIDVYSNNLNNYEDRTLSAVKNEIIKYLEVKIDTDYEVETIKPLKRFEKILTLLNDNFLSEISITHLDIENSFSIKNDDLLVSNINSINQLLYFLSINDINFLLEKSLTGFNSSVFLYSLTNIEKINLILYLNENTLKAESIISFLILNFHQIKIQNLASQLQGFINQNSIYKNKGVNTSQNNKLKQLLRYASSKDRETILTYIFSIAQKLSKSASKQSIIGELLDLIYERCNTILIHIEDYLLKVNSSLFDFMSEYYDLDQKSIQQLNNSKTERNLVHDIFTKLVDKKASSLRSLLISNSINENTLKLFLNETFMNCISINILHRLSTSLLFKKLLSRDKELILNQFRFFLISSNKKERRGEQKRLKDNKVGVSINELYRLLKSDFFIGELIKEISSTNLIATFTSHNVKVKVTKEENIKLYSIESIFLFFRKLNELDRLDILHDISKETLIKFLSTPILPTKSRKDEFKRWDKKKKALKSKTINFDYSNVAVKKLNLTLKAILNNKEIRQFIIRNKLVSKGSIISILKKYLSKVEFDYLCGKSDNQLFKLFYSVLRDRDNVDVFHYNEHLLAKFATILNVEGYYENILNQINKRKLFISNQALNSVLNKYSFQELISSKKEINTQIFIDYLNSNNLFSSFIHTHNGGGSYVTLESFVSILNNNSLYVKECIYEQEYIYWANLLSKSSSYEEHLNNTIAPELEEDFQEGIKEKNEKLFSINDQLIFNSIFKDYYSSWNEFVKAEIFHENVDTTSFEKFIYLFYEFKILLPAKERNLVDNILGISFIKENKEHNVLEELSNTLFEIELITRSIDKISTTYFPNIDNRYSDLNKISEYLMNEHEGAKNHFLDRLALNVKKYLSYRLSNQYQENNVLVENESIQSSHTLKLEYLISIDRVLKAIPFSIEDIEVIREGFKSTKELYYYLFILNILNGNRVFYELLDKEILKDFELIKYKENNNLSKEHDLFIGRLMAGETYTFEGDEDEKNTLLSSIQYCQFSENQKLTENIERLNFNFSRLTAELKLDVSINNNKTIVFKNVVSKEVVSIRVSSLHLIINILLEFDQNNLSQHKKIISSNLLEKIITLINSNLLEKERNGYRFLKWFNLEENFVFKNNYFQLSKAMITKQENQIIQDKERSLINKKGAKSKVFSKLEVELFLIATNKKSMLTELNLQYIHDHGTEIIKDNKLFLMKLSVKQTYNLYSFLAHNSSISTRIDIVYNLEKILNGKFSSYYSIFQIAKYIKSLFNVVFTKEQNLTKKDIQHIVSDTFWKVNLCDQKITKLTASSLKIENENSDLKNRSNEVLFEGNINEETLKTNTSISILNAGVVVLLPYLPILFKKIDLLEEGGKKFKNEESVLIALSALLYLSQKTLKVEDYKQVILLKVLCGIPIEEPIITESLVLSEEVKEECENLLSTVIKHWNVLKKMDTDSLRVMFFIREGVLNFNGDWRVKVEGNSYDIFMKMLPWSIDLNMLPWMKHKVICKWGDVSK